MPTKISKPSHHLAVSSVSCNLRAELPPLLLHGKLQIAKHVRSMGMQPTKANLFSAYLSVAPSMSEPSAFH